MKIKFTNGHIIDHNTDTWGEVVIEDSKIIYVGTEYVGTCDKTIDLGGKALMPAFIDMHTHLRDPGQTYKETMESGMRAAIYGGYCTLVAMANTTPTIDTVELLLANQRKAEQLGLCNLIQAASAGVGLSDQVCTDRQALSQYTKVISNDGKTIFDDDFMCQLLIDSNQYGFLISTHCQPERRIVERDIRLLRAVGGNLHVGHISRAETVNMIRNAKADGLKLTCEVTPHHLFGWDNDYKVNPPMRTAKDVDALICGIIDGTIDCLSTDHAPHSEQDKANGMAGIDNIEYAVKIFLKVFADNGLPLTKLSEMLSYNPSILLGIDGELKVGKMANLVAIDTDKVSTIGKNKYSLSNNTPFIEQEVLGEVIFTVIGGKIHELN